MDTAAMQYDHAALNRLLKDQVTVQHARIHTLPLLGCKQPIRFLLMRPDEGAVCPITHEPIATSTLVNNEATHFDPSHPDRSGIRLPCQHQFTATCLLYYWMRNDTVRCPMCRAAPPAARLNISGLPAHLQLHINDEDEEYASESDYDEASESEPDDPPNVQPIEESFKGLNIGTSTVSKQHVFSTLSELLQRPTNAHVFQFSA